MGSWQKDPRPRERERKRRVSERVKAEKIESCRLTSAGLGRGSLEVTRVAVKETRAVRVDSSATLSQTSLAVSSNRRVIVDAGQARLDQRVECDNEEEWWSIGEDEAKGTGEKRENENRQLVFSTPEIVVMAGNEPCSINANSIITLSRRRASSASDTYRARGRSSRVYSQLFVRTSGGEVRQLLTTEVGTSLELLGADGVDGVDTVTLGLCGSKGERTS